MSDNKQKSNLKFCLNSLTDCVCIVRLNYLKVVFRIGGATFQVPTVCIVRLNYLKVVFIIRYTSLNSLTDCVCIVSVLNDDTRTELNRS